MVVGVFTAHVSETPYPILFHHAQIIAFFSHSLVVGLDGEQPSEDTRLFISLSDHALLLNLTISDADGNGHGTHCA